jgi:hypothetical protein
MVIFVARLIQRLRKMGKEVEPGAGRGALFQLVRTHSFSKIHIRMHWCLVRGVWSYLESVAGNNWSFLAGKIWAHFMDFS